MVRLTFKPQQAVFLFCGVYEGKLYFVDLIMCLFLPIIGKSSPCGDRSLMSLLTKLKSCTNSVFRRAHAPKSTKVLVLIDGDQFSNEVTKHISSLLEVMGLSADGAMHVYANEANMGWNANVKDGSVSITKVPTHKDAADLRLIMDLGKFKIEPGMTIAIASADKIFLNVLRILKERGCRTISLYPANGWSQPDFSQAADICINIPQSTIKKATASKAPVKRKSQLQIKQTVHIPTMQAALETYMQMGGDRNARFPISEFGNWLKNHTNLEIDGKLSDAIRALPNWQLSDLGEAPVMVERKSKRSA